MNETGELFLLETLKSLKGLKSTAEKAMEQVREVDFFSRPAPGSNTIAILMKHMSGNMLSRFTDFLTTDGEKDWRNRDGEFTTEISSRADLFSKWENGWNCLFASLKSLTSNDLERIVVIRGEEHTVVRALQRALSHYAYHTGQIVYLCKIICGEGFNTLSIPLAPETGI